MEHDIQALTSGAMASIWSWVEAKVPAGTEVFDAHAHIGADIDGRTMTGDGMRERMEAAGVKKSIVFPLNDPNARDDYSGPNDVVWSAYEEYPSSFVPFFRLNPHLDYDREFGRCVERGFMGLKLHPVSQGFELDDPRVVRLFGMAAEIDLPVLIHAHSAMVEVLCAAHAFEGHQNVLFETSVVQAKDLYELCCSIDPSRICYGSDIPYGDLPSTLHAILAAAEAAGVPEEALPGILSENIRRWFP